MKKRRRINLGGFGPFLLTSALAAVVALWTWTAPGDPALWRARDDAPGVQLHLLDNGFHTDLAVPRAALEARPGPLADAVRSLGPGDWILIGWGDAKFYVDQSPISDRLPDGGRAFFRPGNPSVVMLDPAQQDPTQLYAEDGRRDFRLTPAGFEALAAYVEASLALTDGRARIAAARPDDDARFFASREHFWIGHLCNHWTAGVLNAGGLSVRPLRSVTSAEVIGAIDRQAAAAHQAPRTGHASGAGLRPRPFAYQAGSDPRRATERSAPWAASNTPETAPGPWVRRNASSAPAN